MENRNKTLGKVLLAIFTIMILFFAAYQIWMNPHRGTAEEVEASLAVDDMLTKEQAVEDIDYILSHIESRHPACIKGLPDEVKQQGDEEKEAMGSSVSMLELWRSVSRIMARMKDGHTSVMPYYAQTVPRLLFRCRKTGENLICVGGEYDGSRILSIGGVREEDLYKTFLGLSSYELEGFASVLYENRIVRKDYLRFLGADVSEDTAVVLETPAGQVEKTLRFENKNITPQDTEPFVSYHVYEEKNTAVLTLKECIYDETYANTLREFFTEVKQKQIENIAVDVRDNGGGNSKVINEFLRYINVDNYYVYGDVDVRYGPFLITDKKEKIANERGGELVFDGTIYILTSSGTFSAATDFAVAIADNKLGYVVGEVSGGMPSSYGDLLQFQTPNAKLMFTVSYKYFHRPDSGNDKKPLEPDYPVEAEEALQKVYELARRPGQE